jgi:hypothetical protein
MAKTKITLALGSYDRHAPLLEDRIQHPRFDVQYVEFDPQQGRHERFLQNFEFDAAELLLSSYLIAIDRESRSMPCRFFQGACSASRKCKRTFTAASTRPWIWPTTGLL